ncbi:protein LSD1-like [Senna tora]|uniref:Protein LSD1-like n=1 Tax=Senna tora TaxID=362788 RepID=A0A834XDE9_9FABA|nr:protein LSD1-like [Senna tora]
MVFRSRLPRKIREKAMQSQLVCSGCRSILLYPRGATNVCCALCSTITSVPPPGMEMSQLYCGGCRTLLMYTRGATSVRCSCCQTVNLASASNQVAHIHCGNCRTTLMYPFGAPSVKCAVCQYITNVSNCCSARRVKVMCRETLRFVNGLRFEIQNELKLNFLDSIETTYHRALEVESLSRYTSVRCFIAIGPEFRPTHNSASASRSVGVSQPKETSVYPSNHWIESKSQALALVVPP